RQCHQLVFQLCNPKHRISQQAQQSRGSRLPILLFAYEKPIRSDAWEDFACSIAKHLWRAMIIRPCVFHNPVLSSRSTRLTGCRYSHQDHYLQPFPSCLENYSDTFDCFSFTHRSILYVTPHLFSSEPEKEKWRDRETRKIRY